MSKRVRHIVRTDQPFSSSSNISGAVWSISLYRFNKNSAVSLRLFLDTNFMCLERVLLRIRMRLLEKRLSILNFAKAFYHDHQVK